MRSQPRQMPEKVKALNLGLMLMNVVGGQVLAAAVKALGLQAVAKLDLRVFQALHGVSFERAYPVLIDVCFIISQPYRTPEDQQKARDQVFAEIDPLAKNVNMDNAAKVVLLALALQQKVGDEALLALSVQLGPSVMQPPTGARGEPPVVGAIQQ